MELRSIHPTAGMQTKPARMSWEWLTGMGVFLILIGVVALAAPVASSIGLAWLIGALFLASGIAQFVHAIWSIRESGTVSRFLLAALAMVAGAITMRNPVAGTMGVTLALCFYLFASAMGKWLLASELRPAKGWGLLFGSSLVSLALGVVLIVSFPVTSLLAPGLFFGIDMLFYGASCVATAFTFRRIEQRMDQVTERERAA